MSSDLMMLGQLFLDYRSMANLLARLIGRTVVTGILRSWRLLKGFEIWALKSLLILIK